MLSRRKTDTSEIVSINIKLAEIIDRVDRLSAALPGEKTMAAVETQLTELSRSLEATRAQSSSDANRIARAAQEILAATEKAQEARAGFEETARHTVKELGQTVVVSASHAAAVTAEQIRPPFTSAATAAALSGWKPNSARSIHFPGKAPTEPQPHLTASTKHCACSWRRGRQTASLQPAGSAQASTSG